MAKRKKISSKKIIRFLLLLVIMMMIIYFVFFNGHEKAYKIKKIDSIKEYNYTLSSNATNYYKDLFKELKKTLSDKSVDEKKYSSLVSQLFISDFYTLSNKKNSNDIGGTQFVYSKYQETFNKQAKDPELGIYAYVENNTYGNRKQELPTVSKVEVINTEMKEYEYLKKKDDRAYYVDVKITYQSDLGYQSEASLVLVHDDKKLEIVKLS